jgi:ABC-type glycerol-3-phosphate transport system substrate-binding protein
MHLRLSSLLAALMLLTLLAASAAADDFGPVVSDVNAYFSLHHDDFRVKMAAEFGVPITRVDSLIISVGSAGDAYLCLKTSRSSGHSLDDVTHAWDKHHKRGWGVVAQELGIKPGSKDFHALKRHEFGRKGQGRDDEREHGDDDDHGKKGKDKNKDKNRDKHDD